MQKETVSMENFYESGVQNKCLKIESVQEPCQRKPCHTNFGSDLSRLITIETLRIFL